MLCAFNRDDRMSLILYATNEWDQNPETRNVFTVQKFNKVTLEMLKEIQEKSKEIFIKYLDFFLI